MIRFSRVCAFGRRRFVARLAVAAMAAAVIGLGGVTVWSTTATQDEMGSLSAASAQVTGHLRAVQAVGEIDLRAERLVERIDPTVVASIRMAQRELVRSLDRMERGALAYDKELAGRIRALLPEAGAAVDAFLAAPRRGDARAVRSAEARMEAVLERIQRDLNDLVIDPSWLLQRELSEADERARVVHAAVVVLVPLGLLLVAFCGWLLGTLRRATAATLVAARDQYARDARTDQLTGIGNRRSLTEALEQRLGTDEPFSLALADLNGFKFYNDTFGHQAGDALLQRLAARLTTACDGAADAFRLGGDEFCVLTDRPMSPEQLELLLHAALFEEGEGFTITCACGTVALPSDASTSRDALRIADSRMYAAKNANSDRSADRVESLLLRMLDERHPGLGEHVDAVAELAESCASALGIGAGDAQEVRRAAELHDIGKVAIPDSILNKPTALDEDEWRFMRRHTVIGERILAASRTLHGVGVLVRSSHERWDGTGYPDGLAGEAIPLGARIVAVCDAFCAMTEDRPYRSSCSAEAALEELRRCAGSQFDPAVVEQFIATYRTAHARRRAHTSV